MRRRHLLGTLTTAAATAGGAPAAPAAWANPFLKEFHTSFTAHWKDTKEYTLNILDAMPADGFTSKPNPEQRTFGEQLVHLALANAAYFRTFGLVPVPETLPMDRAMLEKTAKSADKAWVRQYVVASFDYVAAVLDKCTEADFQRKDLKLGRTPKSHTATDVCFRAYMHTAHHRGQIVTYLRVKGITPPAWKFEPTA